MLSRRELESEVDHSFFDSDGDDSREAVRENVEKRLKVEKKSPTAPAKHIEKGNLSPRTEGTNKHLKQVAIKSSKAINESSEGEEEEDNSSPQRPSGTFMALVADELDDAHNNSPNRMAEKPIAFSASSKKKNEQSPRISVKSQHGQNPSPTPTDASADADSESSCSSQKSNLGSPSSPKPAKSSLLHGARRTRVGSAGSPNLPAIGTDESEDTATDVSPLSSPELSLHRTFSLSSTEVDKGNQRQQRHESVPSSGPSSMHHEEDSDQDLDISSVYLESQTKSDRSLRCPGCKNRKNYTFTNEEVCRIEQDNRLLLQKMTHINSGSISGKTVVKKFPVTQFSHNGLNRKREQQRIERDNLILLKRLESVKPTPGMKRSEQLADYQRLIGYPGAASHHACRPCANRGRSSCRASTALTRPRPVSSRATFTNTDSNSTPVPGSKTPQSACPPRAKKTTD